MAIAGALFPVLARLFYLADALTRDPRLSMGGFAWCFVAAMVALPPNAILLLVTSAAFGRQTTGWLKLLFAWAVINSLFPVVAFIVVIPVLETMRLVH